MGKPTGFLEFTRELPGKRPVKERVNDYKEFVERYGERQLNQQAARCMDCGVPFCHNGCPLGNMIPEFNDAVYRQTGKKLTIFFPLPITSRSLPAAFARRPAKAPVCWASTSRRYHRRN
jgi:hypothetical protein